MFKNTAAKIAHNSTLPSLGGNKDLKPLQDLITAEKAVLISVQKLSADITKASDALRTWGLGEGDDLGDILSGSGTMLTLFSGALSQYAKHQNTIRDHMKSVRTREEKLDELKKHRKSMGGKADAAEKKLNKMNPEHKSLTQQTELLNSLRDQCRVLDSDIMTEEAALGDYKRAITREWMTLKFGGLLEVSEKGTIIGELGKLVIAEIPQDITQPGMSRNYYRGQPKTDGLITEAQRCVAEVNFSAAPSANPSFSRFSSPRQSSVHPQSAPNALPDADQSRGDPGNRSVGGPLGDGRDSQLLAHTLSGPSQGLGHSFNPSPESHPTQTHFDSETDTMGGGYSRQGPYQAYSADDMGFTSPSRQGLGLPGGMGGGRFATLPVKAVGGIGVSLRDESPPGSTSRLGQSRGEDRIISGSIEFGNGRPSIDDPVPEYEHVQSPILPMPQGPPPGAAPPQTAGMPLPYGPGPSYENVPSRPDAIPYSPTSVTGNPWESDNRVHQRSDSEGSTHLRYAIEQDETTIRGSRHVRFGEGSDGEEELQSSIHREQPNDSEAQTAVDTQLRGLDDQPGFDNRHLPPPPLSPPQQHSQPMSHEDQERILNTAAAREVSREFGSLSYSPTPSAHNTPLSPLIPPAPHFARRSISPRPSPIMEFHTPPQSQSEITSPSSINRSSLPSSPSMSLGAASPRNNSPLPTPPNVNLPGPGRPLSGASSPLGLSPFNSNSSPGPGLSSQTSKSTTSLTLTPPVPGTRTISAAAFRRPRPVNSGGSSSDLSATSNQGSGDGGGLGPIAPLSFNKRPLPSSPYPQRSPQAPALPGDAFGQVSRSLSGTSTQNQPTASADIGGDSENFDYITAYVNSADDAGPPAAPQGYGQGRFATNLDDGGLR